MNRALFTIVIFTILLVIVAAVSYKLGSNHILGNMSLKNEIVSPIPSVLGTSPTPSSSNYPTPSSSATTPSAAVTAFFNWFSTCSRQAGSNCDYKNLSYVDAPKLITNLAPKVTKGVNPVFCSTNIPVNVAVSRTTAPVNNTATVYLTESFASGPNVSVIVDTQYESGQWKIINVTCPTGK